MNCNPPLGIVIRVSLEGDADFWLIESHVGRALGKDKAKAKQLGSDAL
jgi:hypothetical protein